VTIETWELDIGLAIIGDEVQEVQWLLQDYVSCFAFNLKELGQF
jgi:hypothetical protein